jgi:lysophospholipase L1-like esterase
MSAPDQNPPGHSPEGLLDLEERVAEVRLELGEEPGWGVPTGAFAKLGSGLAVLIGMIVLSYVVPGLGWAQPWRASEDYVPFWNVVGRELMGQELPTAELARLEALARDQPVDDHPIQDRPLADDPPDVDRWPAYVPHEDDADTVEQSLDNAQALHAFYARLARTELGYPGAITRVAHWGDSVLGNDGITSAVRRRMQRRFGDSGHGFHSLAKYDPSYKHQGIRFEEKVPWAHCLITRKCRTDRLYGYGGVTVWNKQGGDSRFFTVEGGPVGRKWSTVELWYLAQPKGGRIVVKIDGGEPTRIDTSSPTIEGRWRRFELEDGPHRVRVRTDGGGPIRAFGMVFERDRPGVVWDGMALIGGFTSRLAEHDPAHFVRQVGHRDPALIVLTFGGNDMTRKKLLEDMSAYEADVARVIDHIRSAAPRASCLVMSPIDHGERRGGRVVSRPIVAPMVEAQRKVAAAEGCAFFDTFAAMGGNGSIGRWYGMDPKLANGDLAHPTRAGHRVLGGMLYRALMQGYVEYRGEIEGVQLGAEPGAWPADASASPGAGGTLEP